MLDIVAELGRLDAPWAQRHPELIRQKHERMRTSALAFLRATAPIFFTRLREALPSHLPVARWLGGDASAPVRLVWCAGDVHVENFGAYHANDGHERFGLNDFDDALPAPFEVDVLRLAASVLVAARSKRLDGVEGVKLVRRLLATYAKHIHDDALDPGKKELKGSADKLLDAATDATREAFLDKRAPVHKGRRAFEPSPRYPALDPALRARILAAFESGTRGLAATEKHGFYSVVDVAGRVAGLGSLGCARYAVLVEGGGKGNVLMELKEAKPASLARHGCPALAPADEAERIVAAQVALRGERSPHLGSLALDGLSFYFRRLHHHEQRIDLEHVKADELGELVEAEALVLARSHARSRHALGLAMLEAPAESELASWLRTAAHLAGAVEGDYLAFCSGALAPSGA